MKRIQAIFFLVVFFSFSMFSQTEGINYKAIVKDASGTVLTNANVSVAFNILASVSQTLVYSENHSTTTNANGLINLIIGQGTTSDDFDIIDWGRFEHFLNVEMDTGAGFVDLGTVQFQAVPYALHTENANTSTIAETANRLTLKSGTTNEFSISYLSTGDKLRITETGVSGNVLEISNGELTLPQYAGTVEEALYADSNGKLIRKAKVNQTFNTYNFFDPVQYTGAVRYRLGVQLTDGATIEGLNAFVLDNEPGTNTGIGNTPYLSLERESKTDKALQSEEIFRIEGQNTATDVFTSLTTTIPIGSGRDVIDTTNYMYYLELFMCSNCDFSEITILIED